MAKKPESMTREKLNKLALASREASLKFDHGFLRYWRNVQLLNAHEFFVVVLPLYVRNIITYCFSYGYTDGVKNAAWELFRVALCGEDEKKGEMALRFARTYREIRHRFSTPLFEVIQCKSDDGYGDLIDNLPLLGRDAYDQLVSGYIRQEKDVAEIVKSSVLDVNPLWNALGATSGIPMAKKAFRFIWDGENYNAMALEDAAKEYVLATCLSEKVSP